MPTYRLTPPGELVEADSLRDEGRTVALIGTALVMNRPRDIVIRSPSRPNGLGTVNVFTENAGTTRYDPMVLLDFRGEKWFTFGRVRLAASVDLFNALNSDLVLDRQNRLDSTVFNRIDEVVVARVIRFGLRMNF